MLQEIKNDGADKCLDLCGSLVISKTFKKREIQPNGHISVSLGTATYPTDAQMTRELVERADFAMYKAKKDGKNKVAVFNEMN